MITRENRRLNQINFRYSDEGVLTEVTGHFTSDIIEDGVTIITLAETVPLSTKLEVTELDSLKATTDRLTEEYKKDAFVFAGPLIVSDRPFGHGS